jgi:hypothetical protein
MPLVFVQTLFLPCKYRHFPPFPHRKAQLFAAFINKCMRIFELEKPKTPEQLRLDQLKAASKRASDTLKTERERQKTQRAQQALQKLRMPTKPKTATVKPTRPIKAV